MYYYFSSRPSFSKLLFFLACIGSTTSAFDIVRDYSGQTFFDRWEFFGSWDNLTLGDVWWLNKSDATNQRLAYVNDAGRAILRVDNTTNVPWNDKRNTVRITTSDFYDFGSLWVIDIVHLPYGCSVWPAWWTKGPTWPDDGEIDIIEAINLMDHNQMALHTTEGCAHQTPPDQLGRSIDLDCSSKAGCTVAETTPNSFGSGFAAAGGGVWATQFDVSGIYIWFWSRPNIPQSLRSATSTSSLDISQWGPPSASYPAGPQCNLTQLFTPQQLVLDITLCGDWAGVDDIYASTCGSTGPTGKCYLDNVIGPGSPKYDNAWFEVNYVRAYTTGTPRPTPSPTVGGTATATLSLPTSVTSSPRTSTRSTAKTSPSPTPNNHNVSSGSRIKDIWTIEGLLIILGIVTLSHYTSILC